MTHDSDDLAGAGKLIAHFMERLPPGWEFLLRSKGRQGGYMCNLMAPDNVARVLLIPGQPAIDESEGVYCPAHAATACAAVTASAEKVPPELWVGMH